ncbi:MAG: hypothetical protein ACI9QQ_001236, partial [Myxococcota bacterium]
MVWKRSLAKNRAHLEVGQAELFRCHHITTDIQIIRTEYAR